MLDWPESIRACSNCWDTWNPGGSQLSWGSNFVATMTSPRRFSLPNLRKINYYKKPNFWIINWTNISRNSKFPTILCRMRFFLIMFWAKKIGENNYLPIKVSPFVLIFSVQMAKFTFLGWKIKIFWNIGFSTRITCTSWGCSLVLTANGSIYPRECFERCSREMRSQHTLRRNLLLSRVFL